MDAGALICESKLRVAKRARAEHGYGEGHNKVEGEED
jgi:hypothetical protein